MLFDLGLAQAFEVLHDVGPFEAVPGGGEAILEFLAQDESEERTEDVAADCGGRTWRPSFQPPRSLLLSLRNCNLKRSICGTTLTPNSKLASTKSTGCGLPAALHRRRSILLAPQHPGQSLPHHIGRIFADTGRRYRSVEFVGLAPARFKDLHKPRTKRFLTTTCDIGEPQADDGIRPCAYS